MLSLVLISGLLAFAVSKPCGKYLRFVDLIINEE